MLNETVVHTGLKVWWIFSLTLFASLSSYLNIDQEMLGIYFVILLIDLFTGTISAWICNEQMSMKIFVGGFLSKLLMLIVPITIALVVKMQESNFKWFLSSTLIILAISEAISILNNILKMKGKPTLPEFDAIAILSSKMRRLAEDILKGKEKQ